MPASREAGHRDSWYAVSHVPQFSAERRTTEVMAWPLLRVQATVTWTRLAIVALRPRCLRSSTSLVISSLRS
jgi:hypothetical protein